MTTATMGPRSSEFLLSEGDGAISRETVTVVSGAGVLSAGEVLGMVTASSKCTKWAPAASDGSEDVYGVLVTSVDATSADALGVAIVRLAEVAEELLVFASGTTTQQKTTAAGELAAKLVIVRS